MNEEIKIKCASAVVLGMNDALISLTGLITGLAFSFTERKIIILTSILASVVASLSMASSNYLAEKTYKYECEALPEDQNCAKNSSRLAIFLIALCTGGAYLLTGALLIFPFFIISNGMWALGLTFVITVLTIFAFTFYTSRKRGQSFIRPFLEMLGTCIIVSVISFVIAQGAKMFLGVNI